MSPLAKRELRDYCKRRDRMIFHDSWWKRLVNWLDRVLR